MKQWNSGILASVFLSFGRFQKRISAHLAATTLLIFISTTATAVNAAPPPFTISPSTTGAVPIDATVTRNGVTLTAGLVPFLLDKDEVTVDLSPYYESSTQPVRYHTNVLFYSAKGLPHWLFPPNSCDDELFSDNSDTCPNHTPKPLAFQYTDQLGFPIIFIVPEDKGAADLDPGARAYVEQNLDSFLTMSQTSNAAANQYTWFQSFLQGLGNAPLTAQNSAPQIQAMAGALSGNPTAVSTCYTTFASPAQKDQLTNCIQNVLTTSAAQPGATPGGAPLANMLGIAIGSVPISLGGLDVSPFVRGAVSVLDLLFLHGRDKYRYTPAVLFPKVIGPVGVADPTLIDPITSVGVRPNASISDVIFFTIGSPATSDTRPSLVYDAPAGGAGAAAGLGICDAQPNIALPFHLSSNSMYVHDATVTVRPINAANAPVETIPIDPRNTFDPIVPTEPDGAGDPSLDYAGEPAYQVSFSAKFGFDSILQIATQSAIIALPKNNTWSFQTQLPAIGQSATVTIVSSSMPCLDSINLVQGANKVTIPSTGITPLDASRARFTMSLATFLPGQIRIEFVQQDITGRKTIVDAASFVPLQLPQLKALFNPVAYLGDNMIFLQGTALSTGTLLKLPSGASYQRDPTPPSTSSAACYDGGPLISGFSPGDTPTATFGLPAGVGPAFSLTIGEPRPTSITLSAPKVIPSLEFTSRPVGAVFSNDYIALSVSGTGIVPGVTMGVRAKPTTHTDPCDPFETTPANVVSTNLIGGVAVAQFRPTDLIANSAGGPLQIALKDPVSQAFSNWLDVPSLNIVAVPDVASITCKTGGTTCALTVSQANLITGVHDDKGNSLFLSPCASADSTKTCYTIPNLQPAAGASTPLQLDVTGIASPLTVNPKLITITTQ